MITDLFKENNSEHRYVADYKIIKAYIMDRSRKYQIGKEDRLSLVS